MEVTLTPHDGGTTVTIVHAGLPAPEDRQHRQGWPHFLDRLVIAAAGGDPGPDPWADGPPATPPAMGSSKYASARRPPARSARGDRGTRR